MDDFERAVLISFNFSGTVDAALKVIRSSYKLLPQPAQQLVSNS
ncbi:hypothetical protein HaLaN_05521, partial [Haematococcus lacustris]